MNALEELQIHLFSSELPQFHLRDVFLVPGKSGFMAIFLSECNALQHVHHPHEYNGIYAYCHQQQRTISDMPVSNLVCSANMMARYWSI